MTKTSGAKGFESSQETTSTTVGLKNHDPTYTRAPAYSLGNRHQDKLRPTPGPKYYVQGGLSPRGPSHSPAYSLIGKPTRTVWESMTNSNPGPGKYDVSDSGVSHSYSFGQRHRDRNSSFAPAPNKYGSVQTMGKPHPTLRAAPATTIKGKGSDNKGPAWDNAKTPGPAAYALPDVGFTNRRCPAVTLKGRPKLPPIQPLASPGPAAYDTGNYRYLTKSTPRFSIGKRYGDNVRPLYTAADLKC